uniref:Multidrug resistance-associated protein 1 n=1 Tax=Talaromyces marneffei PM1 TaxID=1077442 RepID=A0A093UWR8_TALMA
MPVLGYSDACRDTTFGPAVPPISECRGGFDFTVTFEESIFSIGPTCILLILFPWRFISLQRKTLKTKNSWTHGLKLIEFAVLAALQATLIALFSMQHTAYRLLVVASTVLQLFAAISLGLLSHWEHRNTVRPSLLISTYLLLSCVLDAARARTQALIPGQTTVSSVLIGTIAVKGLALITEARDKTDILLADFSSSSSELRSNIFSRALFLWLNPLLLMGFRDVISSQDLPAIHEKLSSEKLVARVQSNWKKCNQNKRHALMIQLLSSFPSELFFIFMSRTMEVGLNIVYPFLVQKAVTFLDTPTTTINDGYGLLGGFFCVSVGIALVSPWSYHMTFRLMIMTRGALIPMIYSKLLQTKVKPADQSAALTLMTTDVEKIVETFWRLILDPWSCILQLGIFCFGLVAVASRRVPEYQNTWFKAVESRVNLTSHTISSMQSVKLLGISRIMETTIQKKRKQEIQVSQDFRFNNCLALTASQSPAVLSPLLTFATYAIVKLLSHQGQFDVSKAVTSLSILSLMNTPARRLLFAIPFGLQAVGSFDRIQNFLQDEQNSPFQSRSNGQGDIRFQEKKSEENSKSNLNAAANQYQYTPPIFSLQDIRLPRGSFTVITGPIGCGKSTFLKCLLSETAFVQGTAPTSPENIAYCNQTPWIHDGTIRDNIVGESKFDLSWYKHVIRSCELELDLGRITGGDSSMVGSRGLRLSGGQRQRISIARALYAKKDIAIFDDVTSALDARTLRAVSNRVFGKDGVLRSKGTTVVLATHAVQLLQSADQVMLMNKIGEIIDCGPYEILSQRQLLGERQESVLESDELMRPMEEVNLGEYQTQLDTRISDMRRQRGSMGSFNFALFLLGAIIYVVFYAFFQIWITWWAEDTAGRHTLGYWLGLYATWGVLITLALLFTPLFFFYYMVPKSSEKLHSELLAAALRFSQDIRLSDWQLPVTIVLTLFEFLGCIASVGIAVSSVKYVAIGIPLLGSVLYFLQRFYLRTSRQLRLLEIESKAPLKPFYLLFSVQRWLLLVLSLVVAALEVLVMGIAIPLRTSVNAGLVGLAIVQVMTLSELMNDLIAQWTEMEACLGAVTRISRFIKETPREGRTDETSSLFDEWPSSGAVTLVNVSASYEPQGNQALSDISLSIKPGEHVGICGRTGSQGHILIDGVDISTLDPNLVRSRLNLITQEPFLYEGSVRENATPWQHDTVSDESIIDVLTRVDLWDKIKSLGGLDAPFKENLISHGQQQLFCLARALLRESNILILDEPTSQGNKSIDPATDATIQRIIREDFQNRTVIMIAHRLQSLVDFDRVFVLDSGHLVEDGPPMTLLKDESSAFAALYCASGGQYHNPKSDLG